MYYTFVAKLYICLPQSCLPGDRDDLSNNHTCVLIECNIGQLGAGDRVQVEISAVVDERYLGVSVHKSIQFCVYVHVY